MLLDRQSFIPLYHQLVEKFREKIESGAWPSHSLLPSERKLCKMYRVSRGTIREAISRLVQEGLLYRRQGKGTFVTGPKLMFHKFDTFAKDLKEKGITPSFKLLQKKKIPPELYIKSILELEKGEMIYKVMRLILGDNEPFVLVTTYFPEKFIPNLECEDLEHTAMWDVLLNKLKVPIARAIENLGAIPVDKFEAEKLKISPGSPALLVKRMVYTTEKPIFYEELLVRGDRCSCLVEYTYTEMRLGPFRHFIVDRIRP